MHFDRCKKQIAPMGRVRKNQDYSMEAALTLTLGWLWGFPLLVPHNNSKTQGGSENSHAAGK